MTIRELTVQKEKKRRWRRLLAVLLVICGIFGMHPAVQAKSAAAKKTYRSELRRVSGKLYYYNAKGARVKNKWITIEGKRYYFSKTGAALTGLRQVGKYYYFFDKTGAAFRGGWKVIGKRTYYFQGNYRAAIGWKKIGEARYYFSKAGVLQTNTWIGGKYVDSEGKYDPARKPKLQKLKGQLNAAIKSYGGTWSVYVKNLDTKESISINNRSMYAASLIKLYAMGAAYEKIRDGALRETGTLRSILSNMITISDNWSFNYIVKTVGKGYVNAWIANRGYENTRVVHGLSPSGNADGIRTGPGQNTTSVEDCGKFLETVYNGTCVSASASGKMLNFLKRQTRRSKIPRGIPSGVTVANKTGETNTTCHDAAIVYSKGADYIIVVMVTSGNAWGKNSGIAQLSRITYRYFN